MVGTTPVIKPAKRKVIHASNLNEAFEKAALIRPPDKYKTILEPQEPDYIARLSGKQAFYVSFIRISNPYPYPPPLSIKTN